MTQPSQIRMNYHEACEAGVNKQINMELYASYVYMSMVCYPHDYLAYFALTASNVQAYYFDREDVAFKGMHKFFLKASNEEREHAQKFMDYQNKRGGRIVLQNIQVRNQRYQIVL